MFDREHHSALSLMSSRKLTIRRRLNDLQAATASQSRWPFIVITNQGEAIARTASSIVSNDCLGIFFEGGFACHTALAKRGEFGLQ